MSREELETISKSLVGHLLTDPQLRARLEKANDDPAEYAEIINNAVRPTTKLRAEDMPTIYEDIKRLAGNVQPQRAIDLPGSGFFFIFRQAY
jgi:hypothetical protein